MTVAVHPKDVLAYMRATQSSWDGLSAFMRRYKDRKEPFTLGDIAELGHVDYALWVGRMLSPDTHADALRLGLAISMGSDGRLREVLDGEPLAACFDDMISTVLRYLDGGAAWSDLRATRLARSAEARAAKGARQDILTSAVVVPADSPWGGALSAAGYARDAFAKLAKGRVGERQRLCENGMSGCIAVHARLSSMTPPPAASVITAVFRSLVDGYRGEVIKAKKQQDDEDESLEGALDSFDGDEAASKEATAALREGDVIIILRGAPRDKVQNCVSRLRKEVAESCLLYDLSNKADMVSFISLSDRALDSASRIMEEAYQAYLIRHVMG